MIEKHTDKDRRLDSHGQVRTDDGDDYTLTSVAWRFWGEVHGMSWSEMDGDGVLHGLTKRERFIYIYILATRCT